MSGNRTKIVATAKLLEIGLAPRLLNLEIAAAYVGLSAAAFQRAVSEGRYPQPLRDGTRRHWDRRALDAAIDRRSGFVSSSEESPDDLMRAIDAV
jgi:predicted DNA-binding transcriptional regulator AlpA